MLEYLRWDLSGEIRKIVMDKMPRPNDQKKYRTSQSNKGLIRYELQVKERSKAQFETLVAAAAEEYSEPWSPRQRRAKARVQIFDDITQGITHDFTALQRQIRALKEEVAALSPTFFKSDAKDSTPLPEAIRALPDDTRQLKTLLARTYREAQQDKLDTKKYKRLSEQYRELYEVATNYNDELKSRLQKKGEFVQ